MKNYAILYRENADTYEEALSVKEIFADNYYLYRSDIPKHTITVGRYSVLPFYEELCKELKRRNSFLINSLAQHNFIANMEYVDIIKEYTPKTYFEWHGLPEGQYVVKGLTNSRKHQWKHQMFAPTKSEIPKVVARLMDDSLVRDQGITVREYIPLKQFDIGINDLPITNEWRVFVCYGKMVDYGYYWANFPEHKPYDTLPKEALDLLNIVIEKLKSYANFFVLDLAETKDGKWIVIEMNDGQMSGLSMIEPISFYTNLKKIMDVQ
jgi:hypothetical protein